MIATILIIACAGVLVGLIVGCIAGFIVGYDWACDRIARPPLNIGAVEPGKERKEANVTAGK